MKKLGDEIKAKGKGYIPTAGDLSRAIKDAQAVIKVYLTFAQEIETNLKNKNADFSAVKSFNTTILNTTIVLGLQSKLGAIQAIKF